MDFRPHGTGQKKLIIKNFTGPRKLPKNYDVDSWRMLEEAVRAIQSLGRIIPNIFLYSAFFQTKFLCETGNFHFLLVGQIKKLPISPWLTDSLCFKILLLFQNCTGGGYKTGNICGYKTGIMCDYKTNK